MSHDLCRVNIHCSVFSVGPYPVDIGIFFSFGKFSSIEKLLVSFVFVFKTIVPFCCCIFCLFILFGGGVCTYPVFFSIDV